MLKAAYIIDAVRTPIGKYGGSLQSVRPDDLLAVAIRALLARNPAADPERIEDVIAGAANQSGEDCRNVARMAALLAGLPVTVPGNTVNRLCASGLQAVQDAARGIQCGEGDLYIAGGVESMTRAPFVMAKQHKTWDRVPEMYDTTIGWRFTNPALTERFPPLSMGETAENIARLWNIGRHEQDLFAVNSHRKYFEAQAAGRWTGEIVPVPVNESGATPFSQDEAPRRTSLELLGRLKPAFAPDGSVTAGNSSALNDGAAALLLASEEAVQQFNLKPMARVVSMAVAGVHPSVMGVGLVPSTRKALQKAGLQLADIDLFELNEAFAASSIACLRDLAIDEQLVNVNGGALALGNPLGCSGARILITLLHEMNRRQVRYGVAALCAGLGQGATLIVENML